jgi:hypothetical protein
MTTFTHVNFAVDPHSAHAGFSVDAHTSMLHDAMITMPPFVGLAPMQQLGTAYPTPRTWATGDFVTAEAFNTYIRDIQFALIAGQFPIGGVANWANSIASIPAHWQLCDGTSGSLDSRNTFLFGAQEQSGGAAGVTSAANSQLTDAGATWTSAIVGRMIVIVVGGIVIYRTITAVGSLTTLTYSGVSVGTGSGQAWTVGVNPGGPFPNTSVSAAQSNHPAHAVNQPSAHTAHVVTQPDAHTIVNYQDFAGASDPSDGSHNFTVSNTHAHAGATVTGSHTHASPIDTTPPFKALAYVTRVS